jgi:succinoglycan biosynthesis transport protein ExoP
MTNDRTEIEKLPPLGEAPLLRPGYPGSPSYADANYGYGYGEEEGLRLREIWRIIRKHKWLILSITTVITIIVAVEANRARPVYMASAFIEIGKETPSVRTGNGEAVIQADDDLYYPQLSINTHLFRLTSEPVLEEVVVKLKLDKDSRFVDTGRKSFWEAVQSLTNGSRSKNQDDAALAIVEPATNEPGIESPRTPEESEKLGPFVGMIAGGLRAEQVKETRTLKVSYSHTNPAFAAAVTNCVAQTFIDRSFERKTEKFTTASDWLDRTTRELKARVEQSEQELANYTRSHNIFSLEGKETLTTEKLSRLHDQATRAETERILKQSIYEEVKAGRVSQLPAAFADAKLTSLQTKLEGLQAEANRLATRYGPENPQVIETAQAIKTTREQLEANRQALEQKLKSEYELTLRDEQSLKTALQQAKSEAVQQNQDAIQFGILKQEVDTAKSLYTDFLQKTSQAKVQAHQQHNNLQLIQPARVPKGPINSGPSRAILMGFLMSLAAGVGLAYFLEFLDNTVKSVEDVSRYVRLPALGVIPAISANGSGRLSNGKKRKRLLAGNGMKSAKQTTRADAMVLDNRSTAAEAYRAVRTSMLLSAAGHPPKIMLITSGQAGEGKTTTAVNTAISLTQLGASVLLIDCDLRRPSIHKLLGVEHTRGLSTYLSRDVKVDGLIQKAMVPNLSVLPCGPLPPNPAELISSERMKELLRLMAERYDHVLIDSPPLMNVTDPIILSSLVDGVILVIHGGKTSRAVTARARQELMNVGAKVFGVVLNNVDLRHDGYNDYYYYRYYANSYDTSAEETSGH